MKGFFNIYKPKAVNCRIFLVIKDFNCINGKIDFLLSGNLVFLNPMKIRCYKLYYSVIFLLGIMDVWGGNGAGSGPPSPTGKKPPPPPGLPIDDHIIFLVVGALMFGIYVIYLHSLKTKTSL